MLDFRDNEKKQLKMADWRPFWILFGFTFPFIFVVQLFCSFFSHVYVTKLLIFKMAAKRLFAPKR